jgi:hypothetical protein
MQGYEFSIKNYKAMHVALPTIDIKTTQKEYDT